jgi:hypothetical protein
MGQIISEKSQEVKKLSIETIIVPGINFNTINCTTLYIDTPCICDKKSPCMVTGHLVSHFYKCQIHISAQSFYK